MSESPHIKVIMQFVNTDNLPPIIFRQGDLLEISGYVEENHGLTKVGSVSIDFFITLPDGSKNIVVKDILTNENGDFFISIPLSNAIGKYFLTAEPSGLGYQKQLENDKQVLEFFIVQDNILKRINGVSISSYETIYPVSWENRPPLKQFKDGIDPKIIHCKDTLVLIQKYNGTPACVKPSITTKLIERGWIQN